MKSQLWEPCRLGRMELRNRIVMPPMGTEYGGIDGHVTERLISYYEARARGGTGLIIIENTGVHPLGQNSINQLQVSEDRFIPGLRRLVDAIHAQGAKVGIQISHGGRRALPEVIGTQPVAPSAIEAQQPMHYPAGKRTGVTPRELTVDEIADLATVFAQAAGRVKAAGFDGVEIHAAHNYLIDEFISRSSNSRTDEYGGNLYNRTRFLREVIHAVRAEVGDDYTVWCRITGSEYGVERGTTLDEARQVARNAQDAGVDAIHITAYGPLRPEMLPTRTFVPAVLEDIAAGIRQAISVPLIAAGRITPEAGERMIAEGKADLVSIGKGLLADPDIPNKIACGALDDIRPCIVCMNCLDDLFSGEAEGVRCQVNAAMGWEQELQPVATAKPKRVLVVGGGPAGMEAARVAAIRGHDVTLWEERSRLGGQLNRASVAPYKDRINDLVTYYERQLHKLGVRVELQSKASSADVKQFRPEALVLAMGADPVSLSFPGVERARVVQATDVLDGVATVEGRVVIIGGGLVGCETAEYIAQESPGVTSIAVLEMMSEAATAVGPSLWSFLLDRLKQTGIELFTETTCERLDGSGLVVVCDGKQRALEVDTIVLAAGMVPRTQLAREAASIVAEIHTVGDCVEVRKIRDAIAEGYRAGIGL